MSDPRAAPDHRLPCPLWTFNDAGKVIRFRHYLDTAKHIAAAG